MFGQPEPLEKRFKKVSERKEGGKRGQQAVKWKEGRKMGNNGGRWMREAGKGKENKALLHLYVG